MRTLPAEKISAYLAAAAEHGVLPMFYLKLTTGVRRGELVALLWDDLDLENRILSISKSVGRINGEVKVTQPKTTNLVRTIFLPEETVALLVQEHTKHPGNPIMFPSPVTGRLYGPDCIGRLHKTLLKKAGITENIPFHGLRHTFATLAIQQGGRCQNRVQHSGPQQRGLHAGHLHPRDQRNAEGSGPADGELHGSDGIKIQRKMRKYQANCPVLPQNFLAWVLFG